MLPEHKKNESQGVGRIGDQGAGEEGMGMTTGTAPEAPHSHLMADWRPIFPLHQIPWVGSKRGQSGVRMADRADPIGPVQTGGFPLQPLPVGKSDLIQLAKSSKRSYHKCVRTS